VGSVPFGSFADESGLLAAMARLQSDSQYSALIAEYMRDPHLLAVATGWVIGHLLGYVLLGVAFLRSDLVPRWAGALLIAAAVAIGPLAYGTGVNALQVGGYLAVAAASVPVARHLLSDRRLPSGMIENAPAHSRPISRRNPNTSPASMRSRAASRWRTNSSGKSPSKKGISAAPR